MDCQGQSVDCSPERVRIRLLGNSCRLRGVRQALHGLETRSARTLAAARKEVLSSAGFHGARIWTQRM